MAGAAAATDTLRARVERWMEDDPDPEARAELAALVEQGAWDGLSERFAHGLSFGTAGLRGRLGAGPARINVATIRAASAGLAHHLLDAVAGARDAGAVVGHDAPPGSGRVSRGGARLLSGRGLRPFPRPPPPPD